MAVARTAVYREVPEGFIAFAEALPGAMRLPNADRAVMEARKVREYLLAFDHPIGRTKARFFRALGFGQDAWARLLKEALQQHVVDGEAEEQSRSPSGRTFLVRGVGPGSPTAGHPS